MEGIIYRKLQAEEITRELFKGFERYQEVKRCWRKENGQWLLKDIPFIENWGEEDYAVLVECLQGTIKDGGVVLAAFEGDTLAGFASIEGEIFGGDHRYIQLSSLHTSYPKRGRGIGKVLLALAAQAARSLGAKKLYISTHSSEESQGFYRGQGCIEAKEYCSRLVEKEPCDCQLELVL